MKYHTQILLHDPDRGVQGDCFRTALACLLDLNPRDVPHFWGDPSRDADEVWREVDAWLTQNHGLRRWTAAYAGDLESLLEALKVQNPGIAFLLCGASPRGTAHQVIACDGKIIHDPHPEGGGLVGPVEDDGYFWVDVLVPSFLAA